MSNPFFKNHGPILISEILKSLNIKVDGITSNQEVLVFCSDLLPLKSHLQLPWIMGYDLNAELTLKEKTEFLNKAAKYNWWLWFYHDPETVAVKIDFGV